MWGHISISIAVLLVSLLYHYHFSEPASVIVYPETHYDYIVGELTSWFMFILSPGIFVWRFQHSSSSASFFEIYAASIFNQRELVQIALFLIGLLDVSDKINRKYNTIYILFLNKIWDIELPIEM